MTDVLIIIAQRGFQPVEYADTRAEIEDGGYSVEVASITTQIAVGSDNSQVQPDIAVKDVDADNYDAVVVIGGPGALSLGEHQEVLDLLKLAYNKGKIVAAICIAPVILGKAGVLEGKKRATVWNEDGEQAVVIEESGGLFVNEPVVVDGNIITGNGPAAAEEFGKEIVNALRSS